MPHLLYGIPYFKEKATHEAGDTVQFVLHYPDFEPPDTPYPSCGNNEVMSIMELRIENVVTFNHDRIFVQLLLEVPRS
jgi:hypothetical protein